MFNKRLFKMTAVLLITAPLASCNSFNHIAVVETNNHHWRFTEEPTKQPPAKSPQEILPPAGGPKLCPIYKFPSIPKTPELPIKELEKISPNDMDALDRIQHKHIEELRLHIMQVKAAIAKSQLDYLTSCHAFLEHK